MTDAFVPITWKRADQTDVPGLAIGEAGKPGVIVIQEWWGIDYEVKEHAKKIASHGYRCIVPDLYRGKLGLEAEEAHHLMQNLDFPSAVSDIAGAARYLKSEGSAKVGVTGFCMGGALTLATAVREADDIACAAPFYGIPPEQLAQMKHVKVPIQGHYGDKDKAKGFSDPAAVNKLEAELKKSGQPFEVFRYPDVGHAFMNATPEGIDRRSKLGQGEHHQPSVDKAWERLFAFFDKYLK